MHRDTRAPRPTAFLHVRMPLQDRLAVEREAERRGLTLSEFARRVLLVAARGLPVRENDVRD